MERILTRNSENISKVLALMTAHEYNVRNYYRSNRNIDIQFVFDRLEIDLSNNILNQMDISNENQDPSQNQITYKKFNELENQNEIICPITQESFSPDDNVALLDCGHYFKKDAFLVWSRRSRSCPSCRAAFR
jgi:hypothetical protein